MSKTPVYLGEALRLASGDKGAASALVDIVLDNYYPLPSFHVQKPYITYVDKLLMGLALEIGGSRRPSWTMRCKMNFLSLPSYMYTRAFAVLSYAGPQDIYSDFVNDLSSAQLKKLDPNFRLEIAKMKSDSFMRTLGHNRKYAPTQLDVNSVEMSWNLIHDKIVSGVDISTIPVEDFCILSPINLKD